MDQRHPKVVIIVLNWNNPTDTILCLNSVMLLDYPEYDILVVDNGSTDNSIDRIRQVHASVQILETGQNLGYAEGNNVGVRYALSQDIDYICILNNDTIIAPNALTLLVEEAENSANVGAVGPKMYFLDPSDMIFAAGSRIDWKKGTTHHNGFGQRESIVGDVFGHEPSSVDFIIGCCVLFKRSVIEEIGMLDQRYYLNYEDVDWCLRVSKAGYQVRYVPHAILWHRVSATLGQASPQNTYYMTRNAILFFWSNLLGWQRYRAVSRVILRNLGHILVWSLKPEYRVQGPAKRNANILALRDAALRRFGRMGNDVETVCRQQ